MNELIIYQGSKEITIQMGGNFLELEEIISYNLEVSNLNPTLCTTKEENSLTLTQV